MNESEYIRKKRFIKSQVDPLISAKNGIAAEGVLMKRQYSLYTNDNSGCECVSTPQPNIPTIDLYEWTLLAFDGLENPYNEGQNLFTTYTNSLRIYPDFTGIGGYDTIVIIELKGINGIDNSIAGTVVTVVNPFAAYIVDINDSKGTITINSDPAGSQFIDGTSYIQFDFPTPKNAFQVSIQLST